MATNIIISSDETVICPKDHHKFSLHQGITRQTMEKYEREFEEEFNKRQEELTEQIEKDVKRKTARELASKQTEFDEKLAEKDESLKRAQAQAAKAQKDARANVLAEFEIEKKAIQDELDQKERALKEFRERELELLKEKKKLQQAKENLELENQRTLDQERQKIQDEVAKREAEKSRLKFAELEKKLGDAQRINEDLTRKLDQGSQQLQGEVLELELEATLRSAFPYDTIEPVKKGVHGADILQRVCTPGGQVCGTVIWEAKRAENWSDKWLQKLKDDQMQAGAEIAIIVTTTFPKACKEPFMMHGDVWIARDTAVRPVAETLRAMLIETSKLKLASTGKNEKMELLYNYLCSPQFAQRIRAVVETFVSMKHNLDQERNAMARLWKQREIQIDRVAANITGMCGELQAISHGSLHQLEAIEQLSLPSGESDNE